MKWVVRLLGLFLVIGVVNQAGFEGGVFGRVTDLEVLSRLSEAKSLLEKERVALEKGVVGVRRVKVSRRRFKDIAVTGVTGRQLALAVVDGEGRFHVVRGLKRDNHGFETLTPGYLLTLRRENGINSEFECVSPKGGQVLAIKYPVSNERRRFASDSDVIEAIYTPYSTGIDRPEVVQQGMAIQDGFIEKAYQRLRDRKVASRAFEGRLVGEVVPQEVIRVLLINEHIDPGEFRNSGMAESLSRRVLTVVATNGGRAYGYSISSAGARGLVQMIVSTYALLLRKYPEAGLAADFTSGMSDPVNAVMAQVLLCDSDWGSLQSRFEISAEQIGPYLAAAYNGGVGRVLSFLAGEHGEWMANPDLSRRPVVTVRKTVAVRSHSRRGRVQKRYVVKTYVVPVFKSETSKYVSQYHWIKNYLNSEAERSRRVKVE